MSSFPGELFNLSDFNIQLESPSNHTNTFSDLLNVDCTMYGTMTESVNEPINIHQFITLASSGLRQHVDFPTHIHGHWIDLFITRTACDLIKTVYPSDGLSDHMTVIADVGVKLVSHPIKKCFSYRRVKSVPPADFISDNKFSALISHPKLTCSELYQQYHTVLRSRLRKSRLNPQIHG